MLRKIENQKMGRGSLDWLRSIFHFSFSEYYNPNNINFGVLRVLNDDLVASNEGFEDHPHRDMEIISYVIDGELSHKDNKGNKGVLTRGQVQYMSAGTGVYHSEYNYGVDVLRFIQIWVYPDRKGYTPNYGEYKFSWDLRKNKWLQIASGKEGNAPIKINQDVNIYVLELDKDGEITFEVKENRQAYLVQIEGKSELNGIILHHLDAMEIYEENVLISAKDTSHIIVIEMKKEQEMPNYSK